MPNYITLLKAFGILWVVFGHYYYPFASVLRPYSFHIALFFFISGLTFKDKNLDEPITFIIRKAKTLLGVYFLYNLFYAALTFFIRENSVLELGTEFSLYNFFVTPFFEGNQFHLFLPMWFICQLFISQVLYLLIIIVTKRFSIGDKPTLMIFIALAILATILAKQKYDVPSNLIIIRSLFSLIFIHIGYLFVNREKLKQFVKSKYAFLLILIQIITSYSASYILVQGDFKGNITTPFITSFIGIYVFLYFCLTLEKYLSPNNFLYKIGSNSLHIMANHLTVFFVLNIFLCVIARDMKIELLDEIYFSHKSEKNWPLYVLCALVIPVYIGIGLNALKNKILLAPQAGAR